MLKKLLEVVIRLRFQFQRTHPLTIEDEYIAVCRELALIFPIDAASLYSSSAFLLGHPIPISAATYEELLQAVLAHMMIEGEPMSVFSYKLSQEINRRIKT